MPLHLLGKKSWNVYNADNIARVKRDEAEHAARETAEEQRMQEEDAERRLKLLRGESISPARPPLEETSTDKAQRERRPHRDEHQARKRRRLHGEDDTERDLRHAQEDLSSKLGNGNGKIVQRKSNDAPLVDAKGNINLFPIEAPKRSQSRKNTEVEAEKKRKEREFEDQYTMRFSNAAGFKEKVGEKPWYHEPSKARAAEEESVGKNVWGNDDPGRKQREANRLVADDPLALMTKGVAGVRQVEKERKQWLLEKDREIKELEEDERKARRRRRKEKDDRHNSHGDHRQRKSSSRHWHRSRERERSHRHKDTQHHTTRHVQ